MYCRALYTPQTMPAEKTVSVSYRVSPRFKQLLETVAVREHRSQTNMLEALLFDYCARIGVEPRGNEEESNQGDPSK